MYENQSSLCEVAVCGYGNDVEDSSEALPEAYSVRCSVSYGSWVVMRRPAYAVSGCISSHHGCVCLHVEVSEEVR